MPGSVSVWDTDNKNGSGAVGNGGGMRNTATASTRAKPISNTSASWVSSSSSSMTTTVMAMSGGSNNSDTTTTAGNIVNGDKKLVKIRRTAKFMRVGETSFIVT